MTEYQGKPELTDDLAAFAAENGLERVGARPSLWAYLKETWQRREFAMTLARFRVRAGNEQTRLGILWVVLRPILMALVYGLVFGIIMPRDTRPGDVPFIPFLVTGVFIFQFFGTSFSGGAKAITGNEGLVRSLAFPRILLPLATVYQRLLELGPMMGIMLLIAAAFGIWPTWEWLLIVPVLMLMSIFNAGVALFAARLSVHLRDTQNIIPFITRLFFYGSGIFFSIELTLTNETAIRIAQLNPVHDYITLVRQFVLGLPADPFVWWSALIAPVVMIVFGTIFFWQAEERYGRD